MSRHFKSLVRGLSLFILCITMIGCVSSPLPTALGYGNMKGTMHVFPEKIGNKVGRTCYATFGLYIYPLFYVGDASVKSAADNGGITKISLVDFEQENILFSTYTKTCIVVYGE